MVMRAVFAHIWKEEAIEVEINKHFRFETL
jgi:hypothetical protein